MSTIIFHGDCRAALKIIPDCTIQTCVTSPPYFGLRDYGHEGQIGLEPTPDEFVAAMVDAFRELRRCLRDDGTLWINLGDTYARNLAKGGSGTDGKNDKYLGDNYREAILKGRRQGSSDGAVGRGDRPGTRVGDLPEKNLLGIPWRVAFALQADGWYLRQDIIWHKPNPMPESVTDRCTKAHEYIFLMSKSPRYYFDAEAIKTPLSPKTLTVKTTSQKGDGTGSTGEKLNAWMEKNGGRKHPEKANKRDVWTVSSRPYAGAHFATFPPELIEPCVLAGSPAGGIVYDPFLGSGTTAAVASQHGREGWGSEINADYIELAKARIGGDVSVIDLD